MARTSRQPPSSDWQSVLLEAIQQREASKAVTLAQRCVHRRGMATLLTLLDHADAAGEADAGSQGGAKAWLLLLLKDAEQAPQAITAPPPRPAEQPRDRDPVRAGPKSPGVPPSVPPPAVALEAALPADPLPPLPIPPASPVVEPVTPSIPLPRLDSPANPPSARTTTSAALDQAFAPLEIAFPPLPSPERDQEPAPPRQSPPPPPPLRNAGLSWPLGRGDRSVGAESRPDGLAPPTAEVSSQPGSHPGPVDPPPETVGGASAPPAVPQPDLLSSLDSSAAPTTGGFTSERPKHRFDANSVGSAAPVPSFQVDSGDDRPPTGRRRGTQPETPSEPPAPAPGSKSLQAWRAWLPGHFRSRPRA
ncbi:MAG: hypothetical protein VKP63_08810 [Cyanobacteriota bacterium]|nr:hypothetical protein [Cyanobacteriota bacterium]